MAAGAALYAAGSFTGTGPIPPPSAIIAQPELLSSRKNSCLMAVPAMFGDYAVTKQGIDSVVAAGSPCVYLLGTVSGNKFLVDRTGRSDEDVNRRLHDYEGQYQHFKFAYCANAEQAFYAECELWHAYANKKVQIHPARPKGKSYGCPVILCTTLL